MYNLSRGVFWIFLALAALVAGGCPLQPTDPTVLENRVTVETDSGTFKIELYRADAPQTTANFANYIKSGFYEGSIFYDVIAGIGVEAGPVRDDLTLKDEGPTVPNEVSTRLRNVRGTIALVRDFSTNTAQSRFFINLRDNPTLDATESFAGYAVFGKITEGIEVLDAISNVTTTQNGDYNRLPLTPIHINRMTISSSPDPQIVAYGDRLQYAAEYSVWIVVTDVLQHVLTNGI